MSTFPWACTVYVDMHVYFDFPTNTILYLGIFSSIIFPPSSPFSLSLYSVAATCSPITFIGTGEHIDDFVLIYTIYTITLHDRFISLLNVSSIRTLHSVLSEISFIDIMIVIYCQVIIILITLLSKGRFISTITTTTTVCTLVCTWYMQSNRQIR